MMKLRARRRVGRIKHWKIGFNGHPEGRASGSPRIATDRHNGEYLKTWTGGSYPAGEGNLPVTFITWHAASGFCESAGKRLPTEAEWEFAAGRGQPAEFPWGDDTPDAARANWSGANLGRPSPDRRVIRGGSFGGSPVNLRVRYRDSHPELGAGPHVGFRCAR